jgi:membrane associated rhomboid family serine protease
MAFRSNGPIMMALPAFRGVTRQIILVALVAFFGLAVLGLMSGDLAGTVAGLFVLQPERLLHRLVWQAVTYPFVGLGLISTALALLSVWFFGTSLEEERGSRWFAEFFFAATIGGGLLAAALSYALGGRFAAFDPAKVAAFGMWPVVLALVMAFAVFHAEQTITFNFIFQVKAKYIAAIFVLFYLGSALIGSDRFGALTALCNAVAGYGYLRLAPRRGLRVGASEWLYGLRNAYYRAKRRRAAKKFTVYMRRQGKDVSLDEDGRYVDPGGKARDPNDRKWMN